VAPNERRLQAFTERDRKIHECYAAHMWQKPEFTENTAIGPSRKAMLMLPCKDGGRGLGDTSVTWRNAYFASFSEMCALLMPRNGPDHSFFTALLAAAEGLKETIPHLEAVSKALVFVRDRAKEGSAAKDGLPPEGSKWTPQSLADMTGSNLKLQKILAATTQEACSATLKKRITDPTISLIIKHVESGLLPRFFETVPTQKAFRIDPDHYRLYMQILDGIEPEALRMSDTTPCSGKGCSKEACAQHFLTCSNLVPSRNGHHTKLLDSFKAMCGRRRVMCHKDDKRASKGAGHIIDLIILDRGIQNFELKTYSPHSVKWAKISSSKSMQEESDAIVKHYNRVVKGKQCGADGYIPQVWFQNTLHYLTISVYGGINRKKWRKLIHSAVRSPADDFSIYKEWKENPLSKRTWLSYLAIREYEWRVLACAHVRAISAIVHHRIHRHLHSVVATPPSLSKAKDEEILSLRKTVPRNLFLGQVQTSQGFQLPDHQD
jgi:hypothetical protein